MPRIPEETIQQIAAANDIVEVIGSYFQLRRAGATYKALCPFHTEKSPSFTVNPHRQIFKCFGCGAGGSVFRFVMEYEKVEFATAVRRLAERAGIHIVEQEMTAEERAKVSLRHRLLAIHAEAAEFFQQQLFRTQAGQIARDYLKKRGITAEVAKSWKLGYAPDSWDAIGAFLRQQRYSQEEITVSGLVRTKEENTGYYDAFRQRLMFPICNDTGEVIAFSGRVLDPEAKGGKYVNSPETPLFTKGAVLFGLDRSKRALIDMRSAIICEGQIDLITAFESGIQNVIASQGTAFTDRQARILKRFVDEVVLCFDSDAAGEKAAEKSLVYLMRENLGVRIASMPKGEDPDSLIRKQGSDSFALLIAVAPDFFDYQLEKLGRRPDFATPKGKALAARQLAGWIGLIQDPVMRQAVMNKASVRLEVSAAQLTELVRKADSPVSAGDSALDAKPAPKLLLPELNATMKLLALAALHDEDARAWLLEEDWPERLGAEPNADLLMKILAADVRPSAPATVQTFLTTLDAAEEAAITGLLESKPPVNALLVTRDAWNQLERDQVKRRIEAIQAKMRNPLLAPEDQRLLQDDLYDCVNRERAIPPPSAPPPG